MVFRGLDGSTFSVGGIGCLGLESLENSRKPQNLSEKNDEKPWKTTLKNHRKTIEKTLENLRNSREKYPGFPGANLRYLSLPGTNRQELWDALEMKPFLFFQRFLSCFCLYVFWQPFLFNTKVSELK